MYLQRADCRLFYQAWPVDNPQALVIISHGLGEHGGRYQHVASHLNRCGFTVYALDHRGHGQSDGQRGHIISFEQYSDDLHTILSMVAQQHDGLSIHLLGHSMGGLIATAYVLRHQGVASLILSAPAYAPYGWRKRVEVYLSQYLAKLLPNISLANGIDVEAISRTREVVQAYRDDPLVHDRISPAWAAAFYRERQFVAQNLARVDLPVLMLIAGADCLTDPLISRSYFQRFAGSAKQLEVYPQAYHEILNEFEEQAQALHCIERWLQSYG